ncbi:GGDEF domain-containing protein [Georgenia sp. Z1491]|uniref:GGDEF domain-containing protein n=1 Tax=Georgenia sp. Z1491 TaxID=3416707 RepID=UPI003CF88AE5
MTLDPFTLQATTGLVIMTVTILFVVDARGRGEDAVDRIWGGAFAAAITGAVAYVAAAATPGTWWANAIGNAGVALTTLLMWNGVRAWTGRRPLVGVSLAASGLVVLAALVAGQGAGAWGGAWAMLAGTSLGALAACIALLRTPRLRSLVVRVLAGVLAVVSAFYAGRLVLLLTHGPDSEIFELWAGTTTSSLVIIVLITCAAFCMVSMRAEDGRRAREEDAAYDPMTGARTVASFRPRAVTAVAEHREAHRPVSMVTLDLDDHERLRTAFDTVLAERAVAVLGEVVRRLVPPLSLIGRERHRAGFDVLLPGRAQAEARTWAEQVRRELTDVALEVDDGHLRLRLSIGVACDDTAGYDLDDLAQVSRDSAAAAAGDGGNRVRVATREEGEASLGAVGRSIGAARDRGARES